MSQVNKQKSIEKQRQVELQAKAAVDRAKAEADQVKTEKDKADTDFSNNLKCQTLLKDLKQRWNNIVGIYYEEWRNTCIVKYTEKGETKESPIENMQDIK
ncbi:MAG: hypothetical protein HY764_01950 [Candidatus Portnoybacteria bacterium]|nr:hypothetical protein [Candidatus Portnoybacteria bacterium]